MPQLTDRGETQRPAYDFASAVQERFPLIDDLGVSQNNYVQEAAQRRLALQQAQQEAAWTSAQGQSNTIAGQNNAATGGFSKFMQSISQQESGGNYKALNSSSGAMGKYQIMPSNILGVNRGWDKEALGYDINTATFLNSPEIQEKIASYKLQQYYNQYGPAGAAIAWYAGPSAAQRYASSGSVSHGNEGNYPSVSSYMRQILQRMGL